MFGSPTFAELVLLIPLGIISLIDYKAVAAGGAVAFSGMPRPYLATAAAGGVFYQMDASDVSKMPYTYDDSSTKLFVLTQKIGSAGLGLVAVRYII